LCRGSSPLRRSLWTRDLLSGRVRLLLALWGRLVFGEVDSLEEGGYKP
jgi:hypothetical protein